VSLKWSKIWALLCKSQWKTPTKEEGPKPKEFKSRLRESRRVLLEFLDRHKLFSCHLFNLLTRATNRCRRRTFIWLNHARKRPLRVIDAPHQIRPWTSRSASQRSTWWWVSLHLWREAVHKKEMCKCQAVRPLISITSMQWTLSQFSLRRTCFRVQSNQLNLLTMCTPTTAEFRIMLHQIKFHKKVQPRPLKCKPRCRQSNRCCRVCSSNRITVLLQLVETIWIQWSKGSRNKLVPFCSRNWLKNQSDEEI